jgi:hypothetical protein
MTMNRIRSYIEKIKSTPYFVCYQRNEKLFHLLLIPLLFSALPITLRSKVTAEHICFNLKHLFIHSSFNIQNLKEAYCAYVLIIMVLYWMTDCLPVPITALMPVVLYPLFGIVSSKCVSQIYFQVSSLALFI